MPADYGTTVTGVKYMAQVLKQVFQKSFMTEITNRDFYTPGDDNPKSTRSIKSKNQKFIITTLYSNGWSAYTGSTISFSNVQESVSTLSIDTFKSLSDIILSLAWFKSAVSDPESSVIASAGGKLTAILNKAALAMYADAGSGNWIGTSYTTGTVTITATTGATVGSGTTFNTNMVGKPFKAVGHTQWYRVKTYTNATSIVIENDSDDDTSAYGGGAISGAAYEVQANTVLAITSSNIASTLIKASHLLDEAHGSNDELAVPAEDRFVVLPACAKEALLAASAFNPAIERVFGETVENGLVAKAYGFKVYMAPTGYFSGNNTTGVYCIYGHKSWLTSGFGFIEPVNVIPSKDNQTNFGDMIKGLFGYGFKVADMRRMAGGVIWATFS